MSASRSNNPFDSDEDSEAGLLGVEIDFGREVARAEQMQCVRTEVPTLTLMQRSVGAMVRYIDATQWVGVGAAMLRNGQLESPDGYSLVKYGVTAAAIVVVKEGQAALHAGVSLRHPLRYHCALGGGSFARGLVRDAKRKTMIAVPVIAVMAGLGGGRDVLFNWAIRNNYMNLILAMFYLDGPLLRTLLIGAVVMLTYERGQQLANYCSPLPMIPMEVDPQVRWYQRGLKGVARIFYGAVAGEFLLELCNGVIGFAYLFHTRLSLMAGPYYDFGLHEPLQYYATVPRPFEKLDLSCLAPNAAVHVQENIEFEDELVRVAPSKCRQVAGLSTRVAITLMVLGTATVANNFIALRLGGSHDDKASYDSSSWSTAGRMTYVGVMMGACAFAYGAAMLLPETVQRAGRWCGRLFNRAERDHDIEMGTPSPRLSPR